MAKVLTQAALDAFKPSDRRREIPDAKVSGLQFVLQPSGAASWAFRFRWGGKTAKLTLGPYPAIGLAQARDLARKAAADLAGGKDPRAQKRAQRAAAAPALDLIENIVSEYVERYAKKKTRERSWRQTERLLLKEIVGPWGKRELSSIRRKEIIALLDKIADRAPVVANRVLAAFHHLCVWAQQRELIETNPAAGVKAPAQPIPRERVLADVEIAALWRATGTLGYPAGPIVRLLALTGARLREVSQMRWSEVDLDMAMWVLPAARSKNGREHSVPLAPMAVELLKELPRFEKCDAVFSYDSKTPTSSLSRAKRSLDAAMRRELPELAPFVLHDVRRSVASGLGALGIAPHVIEAALNHRSGVISGLAATYNRFQYGPEKRTALTRWAQHIEIIVSGEKPSNVIEMTQARS